MVKTYSSSSEVLGIAGTPQISCSPPLTESVHNNTELKNYVKRKET